MTASPTVPARDPPSLLGVVLRRELVRTARRPRTWAMRAAYTGLLLAFLLYLLDTQLQYASLVDGSALGYVGRQLFDTYVGLQLTAVCLLTPLLVASGIQEEHDARTLDLLTLTGVPAGRILLDQVTSRLWVLFATIAAGVPAVSVLNAFGGFSTLEVVNTTYGALGTAIMLASFSVFSGLVLRSGPVLPAALCVPYAGIAFVGTWIVLALPDGYRPIGVESPFHAAFSAAPFAVLGGLIWLPALVVGWRLTVPVFRILTGGDEHDEGFGLLSQDVWVVERYRTNTILWVLAAGFLVVATWVLSDLWFAFGLAVVAAAVYAAAWQRVSFLATLWLGERLATRQHLTWRLRPRTTRTVFRPVVTWRELFTRAGGAARLAPVVVGVLWLLLAGLFVLDGSTDEETSAMLATLAAFAGAFVAAIAAVATTQDDRRRRTLPLLLLTRLGPLDVAAQKALAAVALAAPLIVVATAWWASSDVEIWRSSHESGFEHELGPNLLPGVVGLPTIAWLSWELLLVANTAVAAATGSTLARQPALAWPLGLLGGFLWLFWPVALVILLEVLNLDGGLGDLDFLGLTWYPPLDSHARACGLGGLPVPLLSGLAAQAVSLPLWIAAFASRIAAIARVTE